MYMIVSKWQIVPGHEEACIEPAKAVREVLKSRPEVVFMEGIRIADGGAIIVMGFRSEDDYIALMHDPAGAFVKALTETRLEEHMRWQWSERGEAEAD